MGKVSETGIDSELAAWLEAQPVFFTATAPLSPDGHVNCSPKGGEAFRVLGPWEVVYVDFTGSGIETVAHLRENGRIVLMFCAFAGRPTIVRLHGRGDVLSPDSAAGRAFLKRFPPNPGIRAIIRISVERVATSCGYAVPEMEFKARRDILDRWATNRGEDGLTAYRAEKNAVSIDGLPGLD
ncbi:MAG: pyridoxamine 5'-phosphate oxidase family protein [Capsulimonadales bacterium]|nr:pyridoxamine 5'-phosphate oxidase family protein [Capsulimonadales bacterium]